MQLFTVWNKNFLGFWHYLLSFLIFSLIILTFFNCTFYLLFSVSNPWLLSRSFFLPFSSFQCQFSSIFFPHPFPFALVSIPINILCSISTFRKRSSCFLRRIFILFHFEADAVDDGSDDYDGNDNNGDDNYIDSYNNYIYSYNNDDDSDNNDDEADESQNFCRIQFQKSDIRECAQK